jgi:hypothetical protein
MLRNRLVVNFFVLSVGIGASAYAQTNPNEPRHDYFIADQDGVGHYLTGAHINTIPNWIKQGRINAVADLKYSLDRFPNHRKHYNYCPWLRAWLITKH